ncbi:MAG: hypothetical protein CMJ83_10700 [Planctomycetes bacterium]|nr:hypothetical protein [Planctomycetota bacterium]
MRRTVRTWCVFFLCTVALLGALAWISAETLRLEASQNEALEEAGVQESLRIAMWRLESTMAPILAQEEARPFQHYRALYAPANAYTKSRAQLNQGDVLLASPLQDVRIPFFRLHFEIASDGRITSPQMPVEDQKKSSGRPPKDAVASATGPASFLRELVARFAVPLGGTSVPAQVIAIPADAQVANPFGNNLQGGYNRQTLEVQQQWSENEFRARSRNMNKYQLRANDLNGANVAFANMDVEQGPLTPVWLDDGEKPEPELFLVRQVRAGGVSLRQGIWIDWPELRKLLLGDVADIFPHASLTPLRNWRNPPTAEDDMNARRLASVPAVLTTGRLQASAAPFLTPTRMILMLSWAASLAVLAAVAFVLRASIDLGERRGRFVSAVTHELRTPLTTFSMYTQMLADGMVQKEEDRQLYLTTLKGESDRLARVVESVLLYSRLEEGRQGVNRDPVAISTVLERALPPMSRRAADGGMELVVENDVLPDAQVRADVQGIEQILLNLVDNACKYAADATDRRLLLAARTLDGRLEIRFQDHGPGVPEDVARELFRPYRRAERHAAGPVSGLGLGLALARGLARAFKGDLRLLPSKEGATFLLRLPLLES